MEQGKSVDIFMRKQVLINGKRFGVILRVMNATELVR